jgi:hypothetical protein
MSCIINGLTRRYCSASSSVESFDSLMRPHQALHGNRSLWKCSSSIATLSPKEDRLASHPFYVHDHSQQKTTTWACMILMVRHQRILLLYLCSQCPGSLSPFPWKRVQNEALVAITMRSRHVVDSARRMPIFALRSAFSTCLGDAHQSLGMASFETL